jgi:3'(2'), 5'-bisphosphate nucleotidase
MISSLKRGAEMINKIIEIAQNAGQCIMGIYKKDFQVDFKEDASPLTIADQLSHMCIQEELSNLPAHFPVLSEEGAAIPYNERSAWETFWVVDPLDGTKEFIKKNDEFTVNIALIHKGSPVLGVIYAPALDILYYAEEKKGAYKQLNANRFHGQQPKRLYVDTQADRKKVVISRSHLTEETKEYVRELEVNEGRLDYTSIGSSLKFCLIAEGAAHCYPRLAPTMEWDTAAGQIIVEEAGGKVVNFSTLNPLTYNKEILINPSFLCTCTKSFKSI